MLNIIEVKNQLGSEVKLDDVMEIYPDLTKKKAAAAMKNAGWEYKVVWDSGTGKSVRRWCEPCEEDAARGAARKLKGSSNIYDVMLAAIERGIDPAPILEKLQELEAEKEARPETEFQECMTIRNQVFKEAVAASSEWGPLGASKMEKEFFKIAILVYLIETLYPSLEGKATYKNAVAKMDQLAERVWTQAFHYHIARFYSQNEPVIKDTAHFCRARYHKKYKTKSKNYPLT